MSARDVILIGVLIFSFGLGFFALHSILNTTIDTMIGIDAINGTQKTVDILRGTQGLLDRLDYIVFALFMGLILALIITSWFIAGNPIFMFMYMIVVVIGVVLSTVFANVWETISQASVFGTTINAFPLTNNLLLYMPIYMSIIGFIGLVTMFAKPYFQREE